MTEIAKQVLEPDLLNGSKDKIDKFLGNAKDLEKYLLCWRILDAHKIEFAKYVADLTEFEKEMSHLINFVRRSLQERKWMPQSDINTNKS